MTAVDDTRPAFAPANGIQARWRYAYDLVTPKQPGDEVTLAELAEALGWNYDHADDWQRQQLFSVMSDARRHLEADGQRTVRTVEKFGWIVLDARGALNEVERRRDKAARAVDNAISGLGSAPREELAGQDRSRRDFLEGNLLHAGSLYRRRSPRFMDLERASKARKEIEGR